MSNKQKIFLVALFFAQVTAAFGDIYIDSSLFAYSEPVTVKGAMHGWSGDFRGGEAAFTHNWVETGVSVDNWKLGFIKRYDYELEFSADTADFIYRVENKLPLEVGKTYYLDLRARHSYSEGLRLSHDFHPANTLNLAVGVSYLRGVSLTEGVLQGTATALATNDYNYDFNVDYFYSRDSLFDRKVNPPDGEGYSIDLNVVWQPSKDLSTSLTIRDLIGRIYWDKAPRTTATASSNVKEYDEQGYVIYKPVLSGYESNENFTQTLPQKITLLASYRVVSNVRLLGRVYRTRVVSLTQFGAEYQMNESTTVHGLYMPDARAVSLGYRQGGFSVALISDALEYNTAHTFGLNLAYLYKF